MVIGEKHSGKRECMKWVQEWSSVLEEEQIPWEEALEEWLLKKKTANRPTGRHAVLATNQTLANLNQDFKDNRGLPCLMYDDEADTLTSEMQSQFKALLKKSYEGSVGRVGRSSVDGVSGKTIPLLNLALCTQPVHAKMFLGGTASQDGLEDRMMTPVLPKRFGDELPEYPQPTEELRTAIREAIANIRSLNGEIETPRLNQAVKEWHIEKIQIAREAGDNEIWDDARARTSTNAWRCAIVYMAIEGKGDSDSVVRFYRMMADYLWMLRISLHEQWFTCEKKVPNIKINTKVPTKRTDWTSIFNNLGETFARAELKRFAPNASDSSLKNVISRWKESDWITPLPQQGKNTFYRKTEIGIGQVA